VLTKFLIALDTFMVLRKRVKQYSRKNGYLKILFMQCIRLLKIQRAIRQEGAIVKPENGLMGCSSK